MKSFKNMKSVKKSLELSIIIKKKLSNELVMSHVILPKVIQ